MLHSCQCIRPRYLYKDTNFCIYIERMQSKFSSKYGFRRIHFFIKFFISGGIFVPSVAASLLDNPQLSLDELASEALIDVITQIADGSDPLNQKLIAITETTKRPEDCGDDMVTCGRVGSETEADKADCPAPSLPLPKTIPTQGLAVSYIVRFYTNINSYEREYSKKSSEPPLSDLLQSLRTLLVNHLALVLQGKFELEKCRKSALLPYMLVVSPPTGLIPELLLATYNDKEVFEEVSFYLLVKATFL